MITNGALPIVLALFMSVTEAVFIFPSEMISLGLIGHLTAPFVRSSFCDPHIVEIAPPCGSYWHLENCMCIPDLDALACIAASKINGNHITASYVMSYVMAHPVI